MYTPSTNVPTDGSAVGESRRVLVMPRMFSSASSGVSAVSENAGTLLARSLTVKILFSSRASPP
jgi:hypothetical protein